MPIAHSMSTLPIDRFASVARLAVAGVSVFASAATWAQTGLAPASPTTPAAAASTADVPGRLRPTPKVSGPSDALRSLNLNNPQPEGKVTPQIRIPLGKKSDAPVLQRRPTDTGSSSTPNGQINDAAAQCEAQRDERARAQCRDELAHQGSH